MRMCKLLSKISKESRRNIKPAMNLDLNGKRAVVCGSTQGIGKASAIELAMLGASVTLLARNEEKLKQVVLELQRISKATHNYIVADFADASDVKKKAE